MNTTGRIGIALPKTSTVLSILILNLYAQIGKALSDSIAHKETEGLGILHTLETKIGERGDGDPEATYKIA